MDQFKGKFIEEASDLIEELERSVLDFETNTEDKALIEKIFRVMHSLKGGSAMFGFEKVDAFTHHLESIYDQIRHGQRVITTEILDITLDSVDHLRKLMNEDNYSNVDFMAQHESFMQRVINCGHDVSEKPSEVTSVSVEVAEVASEAVKTFYISFTPEDNIFKYGTNPLFLIEDLYALGDCVAFPDLKAMPAFDEMNPSLCYTCWNIFLAANVSVDEIKDVFIFVEDQCELIIHEISSVNLLKGTEFTAKVQVMINENSVLDLNSLQSLALECIPQKKSVAKSVAKTISNSSRNAESTAKDNQISSIRVSSQKLDDLIDWVSELVTIQARLSLYAEQSNNSELEAIVEEVEKISRRLRDNVFSIRLIPIENMVTRFQRLVRELSQELGKEVDFITEGTETELDKNIIESLADPIMHIIRNSLDHGFEDSATRVANGKSARGKLLFKAFYSGTNVFIQISDDGRGLDINKIKQSGVRLGLIAADAELTKKEILDLIFMPGFTTAKEITKVSGRGVGMDVVKRKITDIRGEVEMDSEEGKGTVLTIKLPLTLSIIDGLLVKIDNIHYVIPLASVNKCYEFNHDVLMSATNNLILTDEEHIPFLYLRKMFGIENEPPQLERVVVVEYNGNKIGLTVDLVVGEYQAVLKPLGVLFKTQDIISGATILGDGTVALVVDPNKIINQIEMKKKS